jgi:starch synthase
MHVEVTNTRPAEASDERQEQKLDRPVVLISHPTGNQNVRNALRCLDENGMLAEFWTTIAWDPESRWNSFLTMGLRALLARRAFAKVPKNRVRSVPWREIVRLGARPQFLRNLLCSGERPFSIIGMYRHFDSKVARHVGAVHLDAVYAYEGGALETFREAKRLNVTTLYELPSSYWYWEHRLLAEEAERNPEFAGLLPKLLDSPEHMHWKDEEIRLADFVIVPSSHVRNTLSGIVPDERIRVISYGAPPVQPRKITLRDANRPLRVLFVGALIQRKGISYLLDAIEKLGSKVELTLVGKRFRPNRRVDEACGRSRWFESLTHKQVLEVMQESDVLVLPSLTEGCALVVLEALSCGLPVIVTPNTGSMEFVRDGREGFVVPLCDAAAIAARLQTLIDYQDLLVEMSREAQATAEVQSWASYRRNWANAVRDLA